MKGQSLQVFSHNDPGLVIADFATPLLSEGLREMPLPSVVRLFNIASRIAAIPVLSSLVMGEQFARDFEGHLEPAVRAIFERTSPGEDKLFYQAPGQEDQAVAGHPETS